MHTLLTLIGFIPEAQAKVLDEHTTQMGSPGVADMWVIIRNTLPFTDKGTDAVGYFADRIINLVLFPLIWGLAVCLLIYAGIRMITSDGKDDQIDQAKTIIVYTLVGVALSLLAKVIISYVADTLLPLLLS